MTYLFKTKHVVLSHWVHPGHQTVRFMSVCYSSPKKTSYADREERGEDSVLTTRYGASLSADSSPSDACGEGEGVAPVTLPLHLGSLDISLHP